MLNKYNINPNDKFAELRSLQQNQLGAALMEKPSLSKLFTEFVSNQLSKKNKALHFKQIGSLGNIGSVGRIESSGHIKSITSIDTIGPVPAEEEEETEMEDRKLKNLRIKRAVE
jgi:hypothetical protein